MDQTPSYRAVSYMWGNPAETELIIVDDQPFPIRTNLWNFLAQMQAENITNFSG